MDKIDKKIINILQTDGRTPFTEIAKRVKISEGTVRNRVTRLLDSKVIQVIGLIDPYQLGFDAPAIIGVSVDPPMLDQAAKEIANFEEVSYLIMVSGEYDLMVEVMCRDRNTLATFLNERLRKVSGVTRTQTSIILRTFKMAYGAQPTLNLNQEDRVE